MPQLVGNVVPRVPAAACPLYRAGHPDRTVSFSMRVAGVSHSTLQTMLPPLAISIRLSSGNVTQTLNMIAFTFTYLLADAAV